MAGPNLETRTTGLPFVPESDPDTGTGLDGGPSDDGVAMEERASVEAESAQELVLESDAMSVYVEQPTGAIEAGENSATMK